MVAKTWTAASRIWLRFRWAIDSSVNVSSVIADKLVAVRVLAVVLALVPAAVGAVEQGTIFVNKGAAGVTLGMTRAQVFAKLGNPLYQNANGYLQYSNNNLFDVYLNVATKRVRLIGISGPKFCTSFGVCMFRKGGLAKLKAKYGTALKKHVAEDGEVTYEVRGKLGGKPVFTSFSPATGGRLIQAFIGYR